MNNQRENLDNLEQKRSKLLDEIGLLELVVTTIYLEGSKENSMDVRSWTPVVGEKAANEAENLLDGASSSAEAGYQSALKALKILGINYDEYQTTQVDELQGNIKKLRNKMQIVGSEIESIKNEASA